jgi:hypothetical protein
MEAAFKDRAELGLADEKAAEAAFSLGSADSLLSVPRPDRHGLD